MSRPRAVAARYYNEESSGGDTLAGDVTGPLLTNTVVALQNKPIPSGVIGFGNILVSNGASWILSTQTLPTNLFAVNSGVIAVDSGSTNINAGATTSQVTHLRIEQNTRGAITTIGFTFTVLASGAFVAVFPALVGAQLGVINACTTVATNTGAGPTFACTSVAVQCDFPSGKIRIQGNTGAGLPLGAYSGSVTVAYRY